MADGRVGELTHKPPISKGELGGGSLGIFGEVNTKTLPTHSTFHLLMLGYPMFDRLKITD